jgi:hypothetical protein
MARPPVKPAPRPVVRVVTFRGQRWYAQQTVRGWKLLHRVPAAAVKPQRDAVLTNPIVGAAASAVPLLGTVLGIGKMLDALIPHKVCEPGSPDWPGCATPGGGAPALEQAIGTHDPGMSDASARALVDQIMSTGHGVGGGGRPRGDSAAQEVM